MNLSATIAKMRAAGMSSDAIVDCLEVFDDITPTTAVLFVERMGKNGLSDESLVDFVDTLFGRELVEDEVRFPSGPKERWGYEGPITPRLPEKEWRMLRWLILERDGFVCEYCGAEGETEVQWCVDHIVPLSRGGSNAEDNLVACCIPCNNSKGDRLLTEWRGRYK
jgi:hypothetical protein